MTIRVLCIEDDPGTAELIRLYLEETGCDIETVYDGESGLAELYVRPYDVVLVDNKLPGFTGIDVIEKMHEYSDFPPSVIMITAAGDEQSEDEAIKAGANDYIVKDTAGSYLHKLSKVINQAVEKRELYRHQHELVAQQEQLIGELKAFTYAIAHDLKQPLTMLNSSLDLLERYIQRGDGAKIDRKLLVMHQIVDKMNETLNGLVELSRLREAEEPKLNCIDMNLIVADILDQLDGVIRENGAEIILQPNLPAALGLRSWVESLWYNFISNAIKYGGSPPRIEIGALQNEDHSTYYWIKDNGRGLTTEEQEIIFMPFARLQERRASGHGLGLAIARQIAWRLGGEATVSSVPGQGSTFGFTLKRVQ